MAKRLIKVAKELNVGKSTIVEFLSRLGFEINDKPNAKITIEMEAKLYEEFSESVAIKEKADQLIIGTRSISKKEPVIIAKSPVVEKVVIPEPESVAVEPEPETIVKVKTNEYLIPEFYLKTNNDGFQTFEQDGANFFGFIHQGKVVLRSKGYSSTIFRSDAIQMVIQNASDKMTWKTIEEDGYHFYILRTSDNQEIGRSIPYKTKPQMLLTLGQIWGTNTPIKAMNTVKSNKIKEGRILDIIEMLLLAKKEKPLNFEHSLAGNISEHGPQLIREKKKLRKIQDKEKEYSANLVIKNLFISKSVLKNILSELEYEVENLSGSIFIQSEYDQIVKKYDEILKAEEENYLFKSNKHFNKVFEKIQYVKQNREDILDLSNTDLDFFPKEILELSHLKKIILTNNKLEYIPKLQNFRQLHHLSLSNNSFNSIPEEIFNISSLTSLDLSKNNIRNLPSQILFLSKLRELILENNIIENLPTQLNRLDNLRKLSLSNNQIKSLPENLSDLEHLNHLDLSNNKLTRFNEQIIDLPNLESLFLYNNPIDNIPIEVFGAKGNRYKFIKDYLESIEDRPTDKLFEVKLLVVGNGGVGKTSLIKRLIKPKRSFTEGEDSTEGIDIRNWKIDVSKEKDFKDETNNIKVKIWDFGGQAIYRPTHRFFLTQKAVYLFIWDARGNDTFEQFNYWLNIIRALGGNSPIIMVMNQCDLRNKELDNKSLVKEYGIFAFEKVSAKTGVGFANLKRTIKKAILTLEFLGETWSKERLEIKEHLENEKEPYITYGEFKGVCKATGLNKGQIPLFAEHLKNLGVFLYFGQENKYRTLKKLIVLDPDWVTKAVYKVLDDKQIEQNYGVFTIKNLKEIWKDDEAYYENIDELLELMLKFELCFQLNNENFIVPELLKAEKPESDTIPKIFLREAHNFEYHYQFMPDGIINSFTCKNSKFIIEDAYWKHGIIIKKEGGIAEITTKPFENNKRIIIRVVGETQFDKKALLREIKEDFKEIHDEYQNLRIKEMIACSCKSCLGKHSSHQFEFEKLKKYKEHNINNTICEESFLYISIKELLEGVQNQRPAYKVFISYSTKDKKYREQLESHLSMLQSQKLISTWVDLNIQAGDEWEEEIEYKLKSSDIILCLVSNNFFESKYCQREVQIALNLVSRKEAIIIPVILTECNWEESSLGKFNALPMKGTPVSSYKDNNKAFTIISRRLSERIKKLKNKTPF